MDKLRSYGAAKRLVAPGLDHWPHKGSITVQRAAIYLIENASGRCSSSDHPVNYNASFPCSPQPAIPPLYHPVAVANAA